MKKFLLILVVLLPFLSAHANIESMHLGYCKGEVAKSGELGISGASVIEAAIFLPESMLRNHAGNNIETIRVGLASKLNITSLTTWIRADLNGENLAEQAAETIVKGWNDITLSTPYTIQGDKGLYIGYTFSQKGSAFGISTVGTFVNNSLFIKLGETGEWESPSEYGAASIEAIVTGDNLPKYDLELVSTTTKENYPIGIPMPISVEVLNAATETITGFDVECTIEGFDPITSHIDCNIIYNQTETFTFEITPPFSELASDVAMDIVIMNLTDGEDQYTDNNSARVTFDVINKEFKRYLLVEEFTTEQCSNCPAATKLLHEAIETLSEDFPNQINVVCHHSGYYTDWLTVNASQNMLWLYGQGNGTYAPAFMSDRTGVWASPGVKDLMIDKLRRRLERPSYVDLHIDATYDEEEMMLNVVVTGERSMIFCDNPPYITIFLTENDIKAQNQAGAGTEYIHNHVLRAYNSTEGWGEKIVWNDDDTFEYKYDFRIKEKWETNNMEIIAFVSDYSTEDILGCEIENSTMRKFTDFYYDSVAELSANNIDISVQGNNIVVSGDYSDYNVFSVNGLKVASNNLPAGIYIVRVSSNDKISTAKVFIK